LRILSKYLIADVVKPTLVALFIMLSIIWLMQSLRFMDLIVNRGLEISTFLYFTMLLVPTILIVVLPLSFFAGSCYCFKRLGDDNELSAIFASGLNRLQATRSIIWAAILTVLIGYAISLYFIPAGMSAFKQLQHNLRHSAGPLLLEEGTFNPAGEGLMVYIKKRHGNRGIEQILVHDTSNPARPVTWMAKRGEIVTGENGLPRLVLTQGIRQEISSEQVNTLEFNQHTLDITRDIQITERRFKEAEERYLPELIHPEADVSEQDQQRFIAEAHRRLLWPLTPLPLTLLAIFWLAQPRRFRLGTFKATLLVSGLAFGYQVVLMLLHNVAGTGMKAALYGQWALPVLLTFYLLLKLREGRDGEPA